MRKVLILNFIEFFFHLSEKVPELDIEPRNFNLQCFDLLYPGRQPVDTFPLREPLGTHMIY